MQKQVITNTEILMFILGWQGGTIHQLVTALNHLMDCSRGRRAMLESSGTTKVSDPYPILNSYDRYLEMSDILDADYDTMQELMRLAQTR